MNNQSFQPREHLINIKNGKGVSEYLEVKWRLVWFRQECPQGTIETEIVHLDLDKDVETEAFVWNAEKRRSEKVVKTAKGVAIFRATVHDGKGGSATGTKSENAASFPDFIEKAESGSIGRALAALGYGTQFAPEFNEEQRIVDSPVERPMNGSNASSQGQQDQSSGQASRTGNAQNNGINIPTSAATEQQISSIKKLRQHLEKQDEINFDSMTFEEAKQLLQTLTEEYRQQKTSSGNAQGRQLATSEQKSLVNKYCDSLQYVKPNFNTLTSEEANRLIARYKDEYNKRQQPKAS